MSDDAELDYQYLTQNALRGVVRDVLHLTHALGHPPGEHHFYIEFATQARGVQLSEALRLQYPERMTIVLQHQFEGLVVGDDHFEVVLQFKGVPDHIIIPYAAISQFADPSANFALQFPIDDTAPAADPAPTQSADIEALPTRDTAPSDQERDRGADDGSDDDPDGTGGGADVVSLDRFRKK